MKHTPPTYPRYFSVRPDGRSLWRFNSPEDTGEFYGMIRRWRKTEVKLSHIIKSGVPEITKEQAEEILKNL